MLAPCLVHDQKNNNIKFCKVIEFFIFHLLVIILFYVYMFANKKGMFFYSSVSTVSIVVHEKKPL